MNMFERIERLRKLLIASEHDENPQNFSVALNHRFYAKPPTGLEAHMMGIAAQQSAARGFGETPPPPTKKWIACAGRTWADADTAEEAIGELERKVFAILRSGADSKISNYRHALQKAESIANEIRELMEPSPSGGTEP